MKNIVTKFNDVGICEIDVKLVSKNWNNNCSISVWSTDGAKEYTLVIYSKRKKITTKVKISNEQANEIILKNNLVRIQSAIFRSGSTYVSHSMIDNNL